MSSPNIQRCSEFNLRPSVGPSFKEGILTILCYRWLIFEQWHRVHFVLNGFNIEFRNESISGSIHLWDVHSFQPAENSTNMMYMQTKHRNYYFFADTERETQDWLLAISNAILSSYAMGYGESSLVTKVDSKEANWMRRRAIILVISSLPKMLASKLKQIDQLKFKISEQQAVIAKMRYEQEVEFHQRLLPSAAFCSIFFGENNGLFRTIVTYL